MLLSKDGPIGVKLKLARAHRDECQSDLGPLPLVYDGLYRQAHIPFLKRCLCYLGLSQCVLEEKIKLDY